MKNESFTRPGLAISVIVFLFLFFSGGVEINAQNTAEAKEMEREEQDMGGDPWMLDIKRSTIENSSYRETKWTGEYMQMVLMSIKPGEEIDLEKHDNLDQFIRLEQGEARVLMGKEEDDLSYEKTIYGNWAVFVPAGYYHRVVNSGDIDLKLYTIYAPASHPKGTTHKTYSEAREYHEKEHKDD